MERELFGELVKWKGKKERKPLIIQGARQVGKTPGEYMYAVFSGVFFIITLKYFRKMITLTALHHPQGNRILPACKLCLSCL